MATFEVTAEEIRDNPIHGFGPIIALFTRQPPGIICPLLEAGLDFAQVGEFDDLEQLGRLRKRQGFRAANFEVGVQASLQLAGFRSRRLSGHGRPDLAVTVGGEEWEVEVKLLDDSVLDRLEETLRDRCAVGALTIPGLHLVLEGSDELSRKALDLDERDLTEDELKEIAQAFTRVAEEIQSGGNHPGIYPVPRFGRIVASDEEGLGSWTASLIPDLSEEKAVARCMRVIRKAFIQFSQSFPAAVVVGVFRGASLVKVEDALLELGVERSDRCGHCRLVVLVDRVTDGIGQSHRIGMPIALPPGRAVFADERRFALAAAGRRGQPAIFGRRERPGEQGLRLTTDRQRMTTTCIANVGVPLGGGTTTIYFDGRPPTVTAPISEGSLTSCAAIDGERDALAGN
jgi:hypothetical protein